MEMVEYNRMRKKFETAFRERYGDAVLKTAWHVINWWVDQQGCALQDRERVRDALHKAFVDACRRAEISASWTNCLIWCAEGQS